MVETPNPDPDAPIESLSFEQAFQRLGELAEALEAGGLTLADAASRYEDGMILVRWCNQLLDQAQLKITTLKDAYTRETEEELPPGFDEDED